jgi:2-polyprenyl-3-methyl-5-hydroxy-6-metoxy-1,4-benzoquinol methylase
MTDILKKQQIEHYEAAYTESDFEVLQAQYRKRLLLELLNQYQPKHLLEVGCGWDTIANSWSEFETLTIVEPGPKFAQQARQDISKFAHAQVMESFIEDACAQLKPQFDLILLSSLLHEVPDVSAILNHVKSLCSKDTLVHINVPNAKSLHRLLAVEMGLMSSVYESSELQKKFKQPRIFDLESLRSLVTSLGFEVVSEGSFFIKPFTHSQMNTLMTQQFLNMQMLDGLWGLAKCLPEYGSEIYINIRCKDM